MKYYTGLMMLSDKRGSEAQKGIEFYYTIVFNHDKYEKNENILKEGWNGKVCKDTKFVAKLSETATTFY